MTIFWKTLSLQLFVGLLPLMLCASRIPERVITAGYTAQAPVIDGKLDEKCWKQTHAAKTFVKYRKPAGESAKEQTTCWIVYDHDRLYIGFRCEEPEMEKVLAKKKVNSTKFKYKEGETVELFLDPGDTNKTFLQFMVNSNGTGKMIIRNNDITYLSGDLPWRYAVLHGRDFFSVEIAIPFAILHLKPTSGKHWGVNFCRTRMISTASTPEPSQIYSSWQKTRFFNRANTFGKMIIDADFSPYAFEVKTNEYTIPGEAWGVQVKNRTGEKQKIKLNIELTQQQGIKRNISIDLKLEKEEQINIPLGYFDMKDEGAIIKFTLSKQQDGKLLFAGGIQTIDATVSYKRKKQKMR